MNDQTLYQGDLSSGMIEVGIDEGWLVPVEFERMSWCEEHNLPYSTTRTGDDRIVCWWVWWTEAMDRSDGVRTPQQASCRVGRPRLVGVSDE